MLRKILPAPNTHHCYFILPSLPPKSLQLFLVGILVSLRVPVHLAERKFRQWLSLLEPSGSNVLCDKRQGALCTWLKEKGINLPTSLVTWDINHPINVGLSQLSI